MILSTQYFRPPFPDQKRWEADIPWIARTGFDTIYVTACWSWVEAEPGVYRFDDYDRLVDLAGQAGLKVVFNLWSEIQPLWIHRLHPDASMIDHMGRAVRSSQMAYMQSGLTPGCCTDHPDIRARAGAFLTAFVAHYAHRPEIRLWDCWNEMRWMSQADGYICFCNHTLTRYRRWLKEKYGSLEGLNAAWQRRYVDWSDVMPPKMPARTYTDAMLWQQFTVDRIAHELEWRRDCVRQEDAERPIIAHAAFPATHNTGEWFEYETALGRGNDWQLATKVDGYGCSHFPNWFHPTPSEYGARLEAVRSATGDKTYWLAELQGGAAGHGVQAMPPVSGDQQARWIWNGVARGAKAVNFWCWRDEVFSRESGGFGIVGDDGFSEDRLSHLAMTAALFREHEDLLDGYRPAQAKVAVVFEPRAYELDWASYTPTGLAPPKDAPWPAGHSLLAYLHALERLQIPYDVIEPDYCASLDAYNLIVLPWPLVVNEDLPERLAAWVKAGGTVLTEASLDSFDEAALFKYPSERPLPAALGVEYGARQPLDGNDLTWNLDGVTGTLRAARWREAVAPGAGSLCIAPLGRGRVVAAGSFVGLAYWDDRYSGFEDFVARLVEVAGAGAGVTCDLRDGDAIQWRFGFSAGVPMLFVITESPGPAALTLSRELLPEAASAVDLATGSRIALAPGPDGARLEFEAAAPGYHVFRFD